MAEQLGRDDVVCVTLSDENEFARLHDTFVAQKGGAKFDRLTTYEYCLLGEMHLWWETQLTGAFAIPKEEE